MKDIYVPNYRKPVRGSLRLIKVDKCNPDKVLSGATFALYLLREDTQRYKLLMESLSTGTDGTLVIEDLPVGKYKLVETASPSGYLRDTKKIFVEIGVDDTGTIIEPEQIVVYNAAKPLSCCKHCCCSCCTCCCGCCRRYCCDCGCYHC